MADFSGPVIGVFSHGNINIPVQITATVGEPFTFDLSAINESANYTLRLYLDGEVLNVEVDGEVYDCFTLKTMIWSTLTTSTAQSNMNVVNITADGGAVYTSATLIGKTVKTVFTDNVRRLTTDWSFNATTGTLTFISGQDAGVEIQIYYK